jgi:hypothetical protein
MDGSLTSKIRFWNLWVDRLEGKKAGFRVRDAAEIKFGNFALSKPELNLVQYRSVVTIK